MIVELIGTISKEVRSMDDPILKGYMLEFHMEQSETFCVIHGKVTDVYRIVARA